ncbi:MAG: Asp-tRNA(Asn)/Glu-tRNA(Gln) amidotransferase subunit GatB [Patescibacteria group bacterium]|nr:Asp-tRNA(Asn)/Glu-tRNA(Gln) amidotransferase subunit GatB [Patescibacteria group bacterium]
MTKQYQPIIGLEVHAELKTKSKMFCSCKNDPFGADKPNTYTCPVCLGMPGALPVANKTAIEWTVKLGLAVGCEINRFSKFDRKNYFYPDLAKGYQISQYDIPFCHDGVVKTDWGPIGIHRIHLEEDTGKLIHDEIDGEKVSLIDFNRCGVPLVEIVTEPDIKNGEQAKQYSHKLRQILRYLNISDCKMAEGGMRLEANISLKPVGQTELPDYKVEVKNINSFRFLQESINYEIERQTKLLNQGKKPIQETRGYDSERRATFSQRIKEEAADYRYFPDPDLPPIELSLEKINEIKRSLPEIPDQKISRWINEFNLEERYAIQLAKNRRIADWVEAVFKKGQGKNIKPNDLAKDIINKRINVSSQDKPTQVVSQYQNLHQTANIANEKIEQIVKQVLAESPDAVEKYHSGKKQVIGFLIGQTMQQFKEKIDAKQVRDILLKTLEE